MASKRLEVIISGNSSGLQGALSSSSTAVAGFQERLSRFSVGARNAGRTLTRGLTLPLLGFGIVAARELMSGEEAMAQTEAAIESTGGAAHKTVGDIVELSQRLSEMSSIDDEDIQGLANTLLTFRNISGPTFDEATEAALNLSVAMGTDLHAAGIQVGKALNDPIRGLTSLTRAGVTFTDEQRAAITAMVEFGDIAGAQRLILEELTAEFGGSAAALGKTVTGRFNKLKNKMEELGASILEDALPALEDLADVLSDIADAYDDLTPNQQKFVAGLAGIAFVAGPVITALAGIGTAVSAVVGVLGGMGTAVAAVAIATALATFYIATHWSETKDFLRNAWLNISSTAGTIWRSITGAIRNAVSNAASAVGRAVDQMMQFIKSIPGRAGAIAGRFGDVLTGAGRAIIQGLWDGMKAVWENVTGWLSGLADIIPDWKGPLSKDRRILIPTGKVIMEGLREGMESGLTTEVRPVLAGATTSFASDFMPSRSRGSSGWGSTVVNYYVTVQGDLDDRTLPKLEKALSRGMSAPQLDSRIRRISGRR